MYNFQRLPDARVFITITDDSASCRDWFCHRARPDLRGGVRQNSSATEPDVGVAKSANVHSHGFTIGRQLKRSERTRLAQRALPFARPVPGRALVEDAAPHHGAGAAESDRFSLNGGGPQD